MEWIRELVSGDGALHSCFVIGLIGFLGVSLGKLRLCGVTFGVAFVFFVGILAGHLGLSVNTNISQFLQNFGLAIYIFSLGLQVGPSFFPSLKAGGVTLNLLVLAVLFIHISLALVFYYTTDISIESLVGVLCGSANNSAALGAAQQALLDSAQPESMVSAMATACATSYPFGVVSTMLTIMALQKIFGKKLQNNDLSLSPMDKERNRVKPSVITIKITNPNIDNVEVRELSSLVNRKFVISQIQREGAVFSPTSSTALKLNDYLFITSKAEDICGIRSVLGEEAHIDWVNNSKLESKRIVVSRSEVNGKTLESLNIRKRFNVNITLINRAGVELVPTPDLVLLIGDRVHIVGGSTSIDSVESMLGNAITKLDEPNLIIMFVGIVTGILLGSVPIALPGMALPIKLGLTGGSIVMGILFGAFGYRLKLITYTTHSANLFLRELGLVLFLACLGVDSGAGFVDSLINGNGVSIMLMGVVLSVLPILIVGSLVIRTMKLERSMVYGMLCGSYTSSQTLPYINELVGKSTGAVAYSTVYPLTMFLRIVTAQIIIMIFI